MTKSSVLNDKILAHLKAIYDPEIPVNIVDLGLIYDLKINDKNLTVTMTLTNPACPVAGEFPKIVESHLMSLGIFDKIKVDLVFDPPWSIDKISEEGKLILGL